MKWFSAPNYPRWAIANFIVLSIYGVVLRYMQLYDVPGLNYQFILHAHSHFAFSGWMFFSIAILIASLCSNGKIGSGFKTILWLTLVSAYGMLASFSWQGYKLVSICFSTLFVLVTFGFAWMVFKNDQLKERANPTAYQLIRGSVVFLCLSALGPFALRPLAALGLKNTPWYQDAVYFYLHFQMNGFMLLAALGLLAASIRLPALKADTACWLKLFIFSTLPLCFIFTIWAKPGPWLCAFACLGAGFNLLSWLALAISFGRYWNCLLFVEKAALLALSIKVALQVAICIPVIGDWVFASRNLVIGYIHLLTLGVIMPLLIGQLMRKGFITAGLKTSALNYTYVGLTLVYLGLLFIQPLLALFYVAVPFYQPLLFCLCLLFLCFGAGLLMVIKTNYHERL
ncbi:MAG: hypothetical protein V4553_14905 [Bacteroidota bacterium]